MNLADILGADGAAGDPSRVRQVAREFRDTAQLADEIAHRLTTAVAVTPGGAEHERFSQLRDERARHALRTMSSSFHAAGDELQGYGARLGDIQERAEQLTARMRSGERDLAIARSVHRRAAGELRRHARERPASGDGSGPVVCGSMGEASAALEGARARVAATRHRVSWLRREAAGLESELDAAAAACADGLRFATVSASEATHGRGAIGLGLGVAADLLDPADGGVEPGPGLAERILRATARPRPDVSAGSSPCRAVRWAEAQLHGVDPTTWPGDHWDGARRDLPSSPSVRFVDAAYEAAGIDLPGGDPATLAGHYLDRLSFDGTPPEGALVFFPDADLAGGHVALADGAGGVWSGPTEQGPGGGEVVHLDAAAQAAWGARRGWVLP